MISHSKATRTHAKKYTRKTTRCPDFHTLSCNIMASCHNTSHDPEMASALPVGDVVVVLPFSAQARGIQLHEVDCRHLVIGNSVVVSRNISQKDESRVERVTPM